MGPKPHPTKLRKIARGLVTAASVGALTFAAFRITPVNAATVSFAYLLLILLTATFWGISESIFASLLSVICLNFFFLPPIGQFTIADPQNWIALFAFLITAVLVSKLSDVSRAQTRNALEREQELERLYSLSRAILLTEPSGSVAREAATQLAQIFHLSAVSLYLPETGTIYRSGSADMRELDDRLREVAVQGMLIHDAATMTYVTAVRLGGEPVASLALRGMPFSDSALQATTNLLAIALERNRALEHASQADVARRSEELRSTLLDAIAHEFKTPLTSIKLAASALLSASAPFDRELVSIVDEEADRLEGLVTNAIRMARIDAGRVQLQRAPHSLREIVERVLEEKSAALAGREVIRDFDLAAGDVDADSELLHIALRQILDNAVKYSPPGSPITVTAGASGGRVLLRVKNQGRGIPESEQAFIFERFYRGPVSSQKTAGTGIGLAIVREIVQAHDGQVWVQSTLGEGTEICLTLPEPKAALA